MVVWTGKGVLAVLVLVGCFALFANVLPSEQENLAFVISLLITGAFSWYMGKKWNQEETKTVIDKASGQEIQLTPHHSLFWIKLQYWGFIFGGFAVVMLLQTLLEL